jgi:hypothetical protein
MQGIKNIDSVTIVAVYDKSFGKPSVQANILDVIAAEKTDSF